MKKTQTEKNSLRSGWQNFVSVTLIISFSLIMVLCSEKKTEGGFSAPEGMHALDLSKYGKPFSIFVPDTGSGKLIIDEVSTGALQIRVGSHFGISIMEQLADLSLLQQDLKSDEVNKLKQVIKHEPDGIIWESEVVHPEYHFLLNNKVQDREYSFEDIRDNQASPYSKDDIIKMYEVGKKIQAIKKETNS